MIEQWRREKTLPLVALLPADLKAVADPAALAKQRVMTASDWNGLPKR